MTTNYVVLLWEYSNGLHQLILWDGQYTYWDEKMKPSGGCQTIDFDVVRLPFGTMQFTLIGVL